MRVAIVAILVALASLWTFRRSSLCHTQSPVLTAESAVALSEDGRAAYILMFVGYYRPAVGICAFPDGGIPIYGYHGAELFRYDLVKQSLQHLGSQSAGRTYRSGEVEFRYRRGERLYAKVFGSRALHFEIDMERGALTELSGEDFRRLTADLERTYSSYAVGDREQTDDDAEWWGATREYSGRIRGSAYAKKGDRITHALVLHTSGYPRFPHERLELQIDFTDLLPDRF